MTLRAAPLSCGGLLAICGALGIGRFVYTPILPFMATDLGLSTPIAGWIASSNFVGYLIGAALALYLVPGRPRRALIFWLTMSALTTSAMGLFENLGLFLAIRLLAGVASALVLVIASSLVLDRLASIGKSEFAAIHFSGVGVGIALSASLIRLVSSRGGDWHEMWLLAGIASVATAIGAAILIPERVQDISRPRGGDDKLDAAMRRLTIAYGLFGFGYVITATFIVTMVRLEEHSSLAEFRVWLTVGLCAAPSVVIWTYLGRRIGELRAFAAASSIEAAGVILSATGNGSTALLISGALLGATFMGLTALGMVAARSISGTSQRPLAFLSSAFAIGQILGPLVAGYGVQLTGGFLWPCLMAGLALIVGALLALSIPPKRA